MAQTLIPDETLRDERSQITTGVEIRGRRATRIDGGAIRGRNLFHSFETFNIEAGQRVYFANPINVRNILSRVTGDSISNIEGTLGVAGTANLFLLNPNGIVFGRNAELDLRGSFFATTADHFNFADTKGQFSATNSGTVLTMSAPIGVQFGRTPGEIYVRSRSNIPDNVSSDMFESPPVGGLQVPEHHTLALVGGAVRLEGGVLSVENGRIELGSVTSVTNDGFANLAPVEAGWNVQYGGQRRPARNFQTIDLSEGAIVSGSGTEGSVIQLRSRRLNLTGGAQIIASVSDRDLEQANREVSTPQESLRIVVAKTLLLEQNARIATLAINNSSIGDLTVTGRTINLRDGSRLETLADNSSRPGNISVKAHYLNITGRNEEASSGIFAQIEGISGVDEFPDDPENPPRPTEIPEQPDAPSDEQIDDNDNTSDGTSGTLSARLDDHRSSVRRNDSVTPNQTLNQTDLVDHSGYITILVGQALRLSDGAEIAILAEESQTGGINLTVDNLQADQSYLRTQVGRGGAITIAGGRANLRGSQISTEQRFDADDIDGNAALSGSANVRLRLQRLALREASKISTQSEADGANLRIWSPLLVVDQSTLATQGGTERGANVIIRADSIRLRDSNLNFFAGSGGGANIRLRGLDTALELNAVSSRLNTQSAVEPGANLIIEAQAINLNGSRFNTVSGASDGANMRLQGSTPRSSPEPSETSKPSDLRLFMENRSQLQTSSAIQGGNILIDARQIRAAVGSDSDIIARGRITLDLINEEANLIGFRQGEAIPGNGTNDIDSSAGVRIRELPVTTLPEVELPSEALNASEVIAQGCEPRRRVANLQGHFSITGRRGLPLTPYEPISGSEILSDLRLPSEQVAPLVEAQGWQVDHSGVITLIAGAEPQACEAP